MTIAINQNSMIGSPGQINPDVHLGGIKEKSVPKGIGRKGAGGYFYWFTRNAEGKRVDIPLGTTDQKLAERKLGMMQARSEDGGGDPTLLSKKFSVIAAQFEKQIVPSYALTTQSSFVSRLHADLIPFFGDMKICDIGERQVIDYKFMREGKGRNAVSIQVELSNLKTIMNVVRPNWILPNCKRPEMRFRNVTDAIDVYFSSEGEFQAILFRCPDEIQPMVVVARKTGLRRANILGMKWAWVNMIQRKITVPGACFKNRKVHVVKMNQTVLAVFKELRMESALVFPPVGRFADRKWLTWVNYVCVSFKQACVAEGRLDFTFHGLRHDFCSQLVMAGVPLYTVSKMAGHSSIKVTERYSHLSPDFISEGFDVLDNPNVGMMLEREAEALD